MERSIRDYFVQVEPGSDDVLLGKAHSRSAAGGFSNFFVLHRRGPLVSRLPG